MDYILGLLNPMELARKFYNWCKRPRPEIKFEYLLSTENENSYCHFRLNTSANRKPGWFFRIGVDNGGSRRIVECDVRVEKIEKIEGESRKIVSTSPFFLHWANENTDSSRSIYPHSEVFCDVVFTIEGDNRVFIYHKSKHSGAGIPSYLLPGKYTFYIKLFGENILPVEREIVVDFNGDWSALKMALNDADSVIEL